MNTSLCGRGHLVGTAEACTEALEVGEVECAQNLISLRSPRWYIVSPPQPACAKPSTLRNAMEDGLRRRQVGSALRSWVV